MLRRKEPAVRPAQSVNVAEPSAPPVSPPPEPVFLSVVEPVAPPGPELSESDRAESSDCESSAAWSPPREDSDTAAAAKEPAAGEESTAEAASGDYFSLVRKRIESRKRYPHEARMRRAQGRVVVRFVIEADGRVSDASLAERSQHAILNHAALDAIRASSPFPAPPKGLFHGPVKLEIGIVFKLM